MNELIILFIPILMCLVISFAAVIFAVNSLIEVKALQNSTHNVQFVPLDDVPRGPGADDDAQLNKSLEDLEKDSYENVSSNLEDSAVIFSA